MRQHFPMTSFAHCKSVLFIPFICFACANWRFEEEPERLPHCLYLTAVKIMIRVRESVSFERKECQSWAERVLMQFYSIRWKRRAAIALRCIYYKIVKQTNTYVANGDAYDPKQTRRMCQPFDLPSHNHADSKCVAFDFVPVDIRLDAAHPTPCENWERLIVILFIP